MKQMKVVVFAFTVLALSGCAHHRDVRPGADGTHRVIVRGPEKTDIEQDALRQANHFCEQSQKIAAIVSEDMKYTGTMDEATHNNLRTASKVATAAGGALGIFGGTNESNAGKVVAGGGMVGGVATGGDAYTLDMRFKCQ